MARRSKADLTYLCRNCGARLRLPARASETVEHVNRSVLCRDQYGNLRLPSTHAQPTEWTMARWV